VVVPELPEVELTRRRLEPDLVGKKIERVEARIAKLRLPIPGELATVLPGRIAARNSASLA
jgi:formamidopyrimidine-DNA glycosylase